MPEVKHEVCSQDQLSRALTWAAEASDPARPGAWLYHEGQVSSGFLSSPSCGALAVCPSQFFQLYFLLPGGQFTAPLLFSSLCVSLSSSFLDSPGPGASPEQPSSLLSTHSLQLVFLPGPAGSAPAHPWRSAPYLWCSPLQAVGCAGQPRASLNLLKSKNDRADARSLMLSP